MIYHKSSYNGNDDKLYLHFIGDLHKGHRAYDERIIKQRLKEVKEYNDAGYPNRILLMGDLVEAATKTSVGAGVYETTMSPSDQMDSIADLFYPYKEYIDGCIIGNHEQRIYKDTSIDIMKLFARDLGIKYLRYTGVVNYSWNKRSYTVCIWHGKGGGATTGSAFNNLEKMARTVETDIYAMGHVHKLGHFSRIIKHVDTRNGKLLNKPQLFVLTGSALRYDESYADMKNLVPPKLGFPILKLDGRPKHPKKVTYYE